MGLAVLFLRSGWVSLRACLSLFTYLSFHVLVFFFVDIDHFSCSIVSQVLRKTYILIF